MFQVKSQIQALDGQCGIWLSGKVLNIDKETVEVKWSLYGQPSRVKIENVRLPVLKRQLKIDPNDWKKMDPRRIQRGDNVLHKNIDGSANTVLVVDENDPWNGYVKAGSRHYLYEHIKEAGTCNKATPQRKPLAESRNILNTVTNSQSNTTKAVPKENIPPPSKEASATKNSKKVTSSRGRPAASKSQQKENAQEPRKGVLATKTPKQVSTPPNGQHNMSRSKQKENASGSSKESKAVKTSTTQQKRTLEVDKRNDNVGSEAPKQPQKKTKVRDDKTKPSKTTKVVKKKATTIAILPAAQSYANNHVTEEEIEVLETTPTHKLMDQDTGSIIRYGLQALANIEATENVPVTVSELPVYEQSLPELERDMEMPPPMSPLPPLEKNTLEDRVAEMEVVIKTLQAALEEEVSKRKQLEKMVTFYHPSPLPAPPTPLAQKLATRAPPAPPVNQSLPLPVEDRPSSSETWVGSTPIRPGSAVSQDVSVHPLPMEDRPSSSETWVGSTPIRPGSAVSQDVSVLPLPVEDRPLSSEMRVGSTPFRPGSADNSAPPAEHYYQLKQIFETVLGEKVQLNVFEWCYKLRPGIQVNLARYFSNPTGLSRELMRMIFTPYELSRSNVRGIRKAPLEPARVNTIRQTVLSMCVVPVPLQKQCWASCVRAMDQANRNNRYYSKKLSL